MNLSSVSTIDLLRELSARQGKAIPAFDPERFRLAQSIIRAHSEREGVSPEAITGPRGDAFTAGVRDSICAALADAKFSHHQIAAVLHREHSTITKAIRRHKQR